MHNKIEGSDVSMNIIVTRNLVKKYGDLVAVKGVNLKISEGEIFGLLGPNGAGKTTLLSMLSCMLEPTSGAGLRERLQRRQAAEPGEKINRSSLPRPRHRRKPNRTRKHGNTRNALQCPPKKRKTENR